MKSIVHSICLPLLVAVTSFAEPIALHPKNPHYFVYQGKATVLITSGEHYGAVLNLDFDYRTYLKTLARDSLNYTRIFTGTYVEQSGAFGIEKNTLAPTENRFIAPWARSDQPGYPNGGNRFDLDRWNDDYFHRLRDFVETAGRLGIVVEVTLFSSIYSDSHWRLCPFHPDNNINSIESIDRINVNTPQNGPILKRQQEFVRKVVRELNEFDNIFYEIQNEPYADHAVTAHRLNPYDPESDGEWKRRVDLASRESLEWQRIIAATIVEEEKSLPRRHLIAQNMCNFLYPLREVDPAVSILNFHYAWPEAVSLNYGFNRVIGFDESGFAGTGDDLYRQFAWQFMLAGGGLFNHLDYSFTADREDGTDTNRAPGGGSPALRKQLGILKSFLESFRFIDMKPDVSFIQTAPGVFRQALANVGREYAIYFRGNQMFEISLDLPDGPYSLEWIDVKTGTVVKAERLAWTGRHETVSAPEFDGEIALRIERM